MSEVIQKKEKQALKPPRRFAIKVHNDDFTSFEFVIYVFISIFGMDESKAGTIAKQIHQTGSAVFGDYSWEVAESLCLKAVILAKEAQYPLLIEPIEKT